MAKYLQALMSRFEKGERIKRKAMQKNLNIRYTCYGENYKESVKLGYCGDTKTLKEWIDTFYTEQKREEMYNRCNDYIIEMLYFGFGKALKKEKQN